MRIDLTATGSPYNHNGFSANDWLAFRIAALGARLVASASQLRETEDLYSARVDLRAARDCTDLLEEIIELVESGNITEATILLNRIAFPAGVHKP